MKKEYMVPESVCARVYGDAVLLVGSLGDGSEDIGMKINSEEAVEEEPDILVKGLRW